MDPLMTGIVSFQQAALMSKVQATVARKILDNQQMQGNAAVQLIEAASRSMTQRGDELVAATTGLGGALDTYG
jgi:hypothetical protein